VYIMGRGANWRHVEDKCGKDNKNLSPKEKEFRDDRRHHEVHHTDSCEGIFHQAKNLGRKIKDNF